MISNHFYKHTSYLRYIVSFLVHSNVLINFIPVLDNKKEIFDQENIYDVEYLHIIYLREFTLYIIP